MKTIKNKKKQTKRKRTKEHLKEHDEKFKFLFEKSIDAIFVADAKTRKVVDCNKNAEKLIGRSKAEILSMNADDVHPSDRVKETMEAFKRQAEGKIKYVETEVLTKSRKRIPVEIGAAPFVLKGKSYLMGIFRDITGRKKGEEELKKSEEKWVSLTENTTDIIMIVDSKSIIQYINKTIPPYTPEGTIGKKVYEYIPREQHNIMRESLRKVFKTGKSDSYEISLNIPKIGTMWFSTKVVPIKYDGGVGSVIMVSTDITEHKRAEEALRESEKKYKDLVEKMTDVIYALDSEGKITSANEAVKTMLGFEPGEIIGRNFTEIIPKDELPHTMAAFKKILTGKKITTETILIDKDKKPHNIEFSSTPVIKDGTITGTRGIIRDITERKRAEEALRESEERHRELTNSITDIFFAMDKDLRYIYWNKASEKLTGIPEKDTIGKPIFEVFPDNEETRRAVKIYQEIIKTQQSKTFLNEYYLRGKKYIFEISGYPTRDGLSVFVKDITEHKLMEEELKSSEERLKILFESAPDAIYLNDLKGNFIDGNKTAEEMIGYKREELIGKSFLKLNLLPPTQIPKVAAALAKTVLGRPVGPEEYILNRKDGGQVIVETRSFPVKIKGKTVVLGIARDITERKRTEQAILEVKNKLQTYFDTAGVIILVLNPDFKILLINQRGCTALRCTLNEIIGKDFITNFIPKENMAEVKFLFKQLITKKVKGVQYFEKPVLTNNNEKRIIGWHNTLLKDREGQIQAILSTGEDITELERTKEAIKHLEELNKLKDDFLNIATHELKTPLTSIIGLSEMIKEQESYLNPKHKNYINIIYEEGLKLTHIIKRILMVTRYESGRETIDIVSFNLPNFVSSLLINLNIIANKKKSKVVTNIEENIVIRSDKEKISQVIYNLVDNAIKHGPEGQTITITIHKLKKDLVKIEVEDQGAGISPESQRKIFAKFVQLEPSLTRSQEGTGLGLYICKLIVDNLGGEIGVKSTLGKGSTFYFTLPDLKTPNSILKNKTISFQERNIEQ
jgi:PAS domain S-box-containing protein